MAETFNVRVKLLYDAEANWIKSNPILLKGEVAISSDKGDKYKAGDGTKHWKDLSYAIPSKADIGLGNVANIDQSKAIKSITRSGTTFTYTALDGTTGTFTQQDNNTWVANSSTSAGYVASGANQANKVWKTDSDGVPAWRDDANTTYSSKNAVSGGTDVSLVTTGEKYTWNNKTSNTGTVTKVSTGAGLTGGDVTTTGTIKANLLSETKLTNASSTATETANRVYPVALDKNGKLAVNVPWTDNNTWKANSSSSEGYVASGSGQANKVWKTDANGVPAWRDDADTTYSAATTKTSGLMSANDKSKLDGIASGAQVNSVTSVAGRTGAVTLSKSDVGLGNVNNTADSAKTVAKANQLTNERTIALFGDVTGSVNFNGSANVTMATTVVDDSHNHTQLSATDITGQTINLNNLILNRTTPPYIQYYIEKTDGGSANITNSPTTGHPFLLIVEQIRVNTNTDYICRQQFISASSGTGMTYVRYCNGGTWTAWESIYTTSHKPSKADVGLGNVDNTADSAKSVKYATSAGNVTGTVAVSHGGTGASDAKTARANLGVNKANIGLGSVTNYDQSKAIKSITRNGTTFIATALDGTTSTFTQQDNDTTYNEATTSNAGLMSASDKSKLNSIAAGAQVNTVTGVKGDSESTYRTGNINITKANIGLGNVNNTADVNKNVLTATKLLSADVRNDNQAPSWYMANKNLGIVVEFKATAKIGVNSIITSEYCNLITITPWSDNTGGRPVQIAIADTGVRAQRVATSDTAWGSWVTLPNTDTNTWRGITDSYSGTDSGISLSQKGGNALYNALVNGYSSYALPLSGGTVNGNMWVQSTGGTTERDLGVTNTALGQNLYLYTGHQNGAGLYSNKFGSMIRVENSGATTMYTNDWFRSIGGSGWYSQDYGGGWHMTDSTWIRSYGDKKIFTNNSGWDAYYTAGGMRADKGFGSDGGSIQLYPHHDNEINFGGTSTSTDIFFGYRAMDSRSKPTAYHFGNNDATVYAANFSGKINGLNLKMSLSGSTLTITA